MSIINAIDRAYQIMEERNWDTIYWCIDLHGVCLESNYKNGDYCFINEDVIFGMREICKRQESKIILWSSAYSEEQIKIIEFLENNGIRVDFFNDNPLESNTQTGCFDKKFYFSVLLDDKAGFDPKHDWSDIVGYFRAKDGKVDVRY